MSKLNKIITNQPVVLTEEEVNNLSETLSAVRTAGGGEGGHLYTGDNKYIGVDNGNYKIKFLDNAAEKLESISSKLDKTEAANTYLTSADAQTLYQTKEAMSDYAKKTEIPDSITDFADTETVIYSYINPATADIQQQINGKQNKLQFDLNAKGEISAIGPLNNTTALAGANGITGDYYSASNPSGFITSSVGALDNFYSKTDTSSKTEIENAFDNIPKYILNGDSNITATSAQDGKNVRWDLAVNATPVVTDTTLTGENGIYTHTTTKSGEWCVELVQSAYAAINDVQNKLDTSVAAQTYQPKGDYVSSTDISDMATKTWVGTQGYITVIPSEYVTDTELQTTLGDYATNTLVQNTSAAIIELMPVTAGLAYETDLQIVSAGVDYVSAHAITAHQSLTDYYTKSQTSGATEISNALSNKVNKPSTALKNNYLVLRTDNAGDVSGWVDFNANVYSKSEADGRYQKIADMGSYLTTAKYATDSATFYPTSNPAGYLTKTVADTYYQPTGYYATSAGLTAGNQYAMTTTGWAKVSTPTIPDITANNGISANGHTIGIDNTNLVANTKYAWTTTGWSDIGLSAYLPLSGGEISGDIIVKSTGKNLLAVNTTATLIGQSRVNNLTDTTAIGTNWMGVNSLGGGFLKNVQGGNVGDLNGTSIQINFAPNGNTAYGNITVESQGNISKVVHVPTASYDSMSSFDNTNGPNYMLRKTASGFDIGACVINVQSLPAQTEANTYYFIYDT